MNEQTSLAVVSKYLRVSQTHKHIEVASPSQIEQLPNAIQYHIKELKKLGYHLQIVIS